MPRPDNAEIIALRARVEKLEKALSGIAGAAHDAQGGNGLIRAEAVIAVALAALEGSE